MPSEANGSGNSVDGPTRQPKAAAQAGHKVATDNTSGAQKPNGSHARNEGNRRGGGQQRRRKKNKPRLCRFFAAGHCKLGADCKFPHPDGQAGSAPPKGDGPQAAGAAGAGAGRNKRRRPRKNRGQQQQGQQQQGQRPQQGQQQQQQQQQQQPQYQDQQEVQQNGRHEGRGGRRGGPRLFDSQSYGGNRDPPQHGGGRGRGAPGPAEPRQYVERSRGMPTDVRLDPQPTAPVLGAFLPGGVLGQTEEPLYAERRWTDDRPVDDRRHDPYSRQQQPPPNANGFDYLPNGARAPAPAPAPQYASQQQQQQQQGGQQLRQPDAAPRRGHGHTVSQSSQDSRFAPDDRKAAQQQHQKQRQGTVVAGPVARPGYVEPRRAIHRERDARAELMLFGEATTGINFASYDNIPVEVSGRDIAPPIEGFDSVQVPPILRENIQRCHYKTPTPIQKNAIPVGLEGRDIMGCAQTGSGKTAAFLFPFISMMLTGDLPQPRPTPRSFRRKVMPHGLVLAPTRELATQIYDESLKFTYMTTMRSVVVYGGQDIRVQFRELDRGCDLLVATPGRLMDFLERGRISMANCAYLVLDEADRMLDMGFEPQIRAIVQRTDMFSKGRQTLMFSATFPTEIQKLAQDFLHDYVFLAVGRVGSTCELITQKVEYVDDRDKKEVLMRMLPRCQGLTLIFVERKRSADLLEDWLVSMGVNALSIHGDRSQEEREHALAMFRCGRCPVLVATDVAARGLDIPNVMDVFNFDMPNNIDDYVHRIGRTGRCGNVGTAVTFVNDRNRSVLKELYDILRENKQGVPSWFEDMVASYGRSGGNFGRGGGRRGRGGGGFGARDARDDGALETSHRPRGGGGGGGGYQGGGGGGGGYQGGGGGGGGPPSKAKGKGRKKRDAWSGPAIGGARNSGGAYQSTDAW